MVSVEAFWRLPLLALLCKMVRAMPYAEPAEPAVMQFEKPAPTMKPAMDVIHIVDDPNNPAPCVGLHCGTPVNGGGPVSPKHPHGSHASPKDQRLPAQGSANIPRPAPSYTKPAPSPRDAPGTKGHTPTSVKSQLSLPDVQDVMVDQSQLVPGRDSTVVVDPSPSDQVSLLDPYPGELPPPYPSHRPVQQTPQKPNQDSALLTQPAAPVVDPQLVQRQMNQQNRYPSPAAGPSTIITGSLVPGTGEQTPGHLMSMQHGIVQLPGAEIEHAEGGELPCGALEYEVGEEMCCAGVVKQVPEHARRGLFKCCGTAVYNSSGQGCCVYRVQTTGVQIQTMAKVISLHTQTCCSASPANQPTSKHLPCCGHMSYDPQTSICCNGRLVPGSYQRGHRCCGTTAFVHGVESCCGNAVVYNPKDDVCCGSKLTAMRGRGVVACCGNNPYRRSSNAMCCNGQLHQVTNTESRRLACCGAYKYDAYTQECCNGMVRYKSGQACVSTGSPLNNINQPQVVHQLPAGQVPAAVPAQGTHTVFQTNPLPGHGGSPAYPSNPAPGQPANPVFQTSPFPSQGTNAIFQPQPGTPGATYPGSQLFSQPVLASAGRGHSGLVMAPPGMPGSPQLSSPIQGSYPQSSQSSVQPVGRAPYQDQADIFLHSIGETGRKTQQQATGSDATPTPEPW